MIDHLRGNPRGLVKHGSTFVAFITTELDRHDGSVLTEDHIRDTVATGRVLTNCFSNVCGMRLRWCAEVNRNNGSIKFFGWGDYPIPIETATKIGEQIHNVLGSQGLLGRDGRREIVPFNHPQVLLPMRPDKTTVIDTGVVPQCTRKVRDDDTRKMEDYQAYSIVTFCEWLERGHHFCEETLLEALKQACANLPDEVPTKEGELEKSDDLADAVEEDILTSGKVLEKYSGKAADNPNSLERQHYAFLELCRKVRRIATEQEALAYIQANGLYTGQWKDNLARRRARVRWILERIAETFDPAKCSGIRHEIPVGKYDQWAKTFVGTVRGQDRRNLDEFGNLIVRKSKYLVDWQFASTFLSVVEYCLVTSPNEDGSLPQVRAEEIWSRCYEGSQTTVPFCERKWAVCRDWLESRGIIKVVDRDWQRGKAMRWQVGKDFNGLPEWWRRRKEPSLLEAVPLGEFLLDNNRENPQALNTYPVLAGRDLAVASRCESVPTRSPPLWSS